MSTWIYSLAEKCLGYIDRLRSPESREKERQRFRELYLGADYLEQGKKERIKRFGVLIVVLLSAVMLALLAELKSISSHVPIQDNRIYRQEGSPELELDWEAGEEKGSIRVVLKSQRIPTEERDVLFQEAESYIRSSIQGNNENLRSLRGDLVFPDIVPGTEITVVCQPGSYHWLNADGSRTRHALPEEGAEEKLTVTMQYYEEERQFVLDLLLLPEDKEEDLFRKKLETELLFRVADNTGEYVRLPTEMEGVSVEWSVQRENKGVVVLFLGIAVAALIPISERKRQEEQLRKREQEMLEDYPELVSKYLLLLNAGLSSRSVWERITSDYMRKRRKRYVYEEMLLTMREMENGIVEAKAYERFGKRCRLLPYMRFSGVLVQNLQKGARGGLDLLEQEAITAFAERKEAAKRKGEEAGTKLLLPMFGLLGIVLVIIMFPAFYSL